MISFFGIVITASYSVVSAFQSSFIYITSPCRRHPSLSLLMSLNLNEKRYQVSKDILKGLQSPSPGNLDIVLDFYDGITGLYSEGVWHNCLAGIASLQLRKVNHHQKYLDDAKQIANSLFKYSWDGTSFRRRAWSGKWDHTRLLDDNNDIEQANYYLESSEHRCIQHAVALVFYSMSAQIESSSTIHDQQSLILKQFIDQFWNGRHWTTISKSQGSGTTLRPSASSGKKTNTDSSSDDVVPYFRAVDQALAVLALLEHIKLLDSTEKDDSSNSVEREHIVHIIQTTCKGILNDFGYSDLSNARTYLGINRNRNFWHEGWIILALSCAQEYVWPMDTREGHIQLLWNGIEKLYTTSSTSIDGEGNDDVDYTVYHWPISEKDINSNVRYCGDNTLAYAIRRSLRYDTANSDDKDIAFWRFIDLLRSNGDRDGHNYHHLASVADVYTQVRLHPNTELAALLLWPT